MRSDLVVTFENGFDDGLFGEGFAGLGSFLTLLDLWFEIIDVKLEDVFIFDGVGDGVLMEFFLEDVFGGLVGGFCAVNLTNSGVFGEDRRASEAEELRVGKEVLDSLVVFTELGTVALIEDDGYALIGKRSELLFVGLLVSSLATGIAFAVLVEGEAEFLDGGDDDLIGVVGRKQTANQRMSVGIFLNTAFLKFIEFFPCLAVEVLTIDNEKALVYVRVGLEEGRCLEGGKGLARSRGMPNIAITAILIDAIHDVLNGIDLIGPHHE